MDALTHNYAYPLPQISAPKVHRLQTLGKSFGWLRGAGLRILNIVDLFDLSRLPLLLLRIDRIWHKPRTSFFAWTTR